MPKVKYSERINRLKGAIKVLKDGLNKVKGGDCDYYITLACVLRSLVAGGGRNFKPLLIDLAKINKYYLKCFGSGSISTYREVLGNETVENNLISLHSQHFITLQQFSPAQSEYSLDEWLESETMALFGKIYTPNYILRAVADREASHYDTKHPKKYLDLKNIVSETNIGQQNDVIKFLIELGDVVVFFGESLSEKIH